jgi:adenylylsulfate kinase
MPGPRTYAFKNSTVVMELHRSPLECYVAEPTKDAFNMKRPLENDTVAVGTIPARLNSLSADVASATGSLVVGEAARTTQRGLTVWLTGLSGSGKTTICQGVDIELSSRGFQVQVLDGDIVRKYLSSDLGFSKKDRDENVRRIGFVAQLLARNGIIVLVAAISPYRQARDALRKDIGDFIEVYVNAPLSVCEDRDPKGHYRKARAGEIREFTGIDSPYEPPITPDVQCDTDKEGPEESQRKVVEAVLSRISNRLEDNLATTQE